MSNTVRHTFVVTGATLVSRLLGFGRDMGMAWLLGGGPLADALSAALRLPYLGRRLLGEGVLSMPLTVCCGRRPEAAARLAQAATRRVALGAAALALLGMLAADPLIWLLAPGLDASGREQAATLLRLCLPYLAFAVLASGHMAALHSCSRFLLPGLLPGLFNITVLLFIAAAFALLRAEPQTRPLYIAELLAAGVLCSGIAQWLAQAPAAARLRRRESGPEPSGPEIRFALSRIPPGLLAAAMPQLAFVLGGCLASFLPEGHMAALFYAERLIEFPLGVAGAAAGIAATPVLARLASNRKMPGGAPDNGARAAAGALKAEADRALRLSIALNLPAAAGLAAVSIPLVAILFGHGAFDERAVRLTASALWAYAPGLPAYALSRPLLALCQAADDRQTPFRAALAGLSATLAAAALLLTSHCPTAPALAVSAGLWCNAVLLWRGAARSAGLSFPLRFTLWQAAISLLTFCAADMTVTLAGRLHFSTALQLAAAVLAGLLTHTLLCFKTDLFSLLRR